MKSRIAFFRAVQGVTNKTMNVVSKDEFYERAQRQAINEALEAKGIRERNYRIMKVEF